MPDKFQILKNSESSVKEFSDITRRGIPSAVFGVSDSFKHFLATVIEDKVLYVVKDMISAYSAVKELNEFSDSLSVYIPPKDEILSKKLAFSKENSFNRISAISKIERSKFIVVTVDSLMQLFPRKLTSLTFEKEKDYQVSTIVKSLISLGYKRVENVESKGSFSVRGDLLDIFPINSEYPLRIDFFGDSVESIKEYDIDTRKNLGYKNRVDVLQASEFLFSEEDYSLLKSLIDNEVQKADKERKLRLKTVVEDMQVSLTEKLPEGLETLCPISSNSVTLFELLPKNTVIVLDEAKRIYEMAKLVETEFTERFNSLFKAGEVFSFEQKNSLTVDDITEKFKQYRITAFQGISTAIPFFDPLKIINPKVSGVANYKFNFKELFVDLKNWIYSGYTVLLYVGQSKKGEILRKDLSNNDFVYSVNPKELKGICFLEERLSSGFIFHEDKVVILGESNLFVERAKSTIKVKKQAFFTAPERGDYCVHEIYGIGRVLGNKKITTIEGTKDYISVEYAEGDILYVPVEQMDMLTRYLGSEKSPKLSKIGGKDFEKIKQKAKESIKKMSFDLKRLYRERESLTGFKFESDSESEEEFNSAFPFEETPDQKTCEDEIKSDMTSGKVMDRLVTGDVGFGKTEVAFRAVFRAVMNGKQVAMLAPTTILTEQHYNTAKERFKNFGVEIACLNRFRSDKEQKRIISLLKEGKIDFIIGTHRLLSKDVQFKDLGLLVLDEEQRFGVEHKEKIKLLKNDVDTITLTATPIPRTLHMSLSGIRSISAINTPPLNRLPVQTFVTEETDALIKDTVMREINRGGQVFILYNRVETIFKFAERVKEILPNVKITVAHGRMEETVLEKNIMDFYAGKSDILISTTIIENGIDLPKANTLIVIDADLLGLSTLYQLKGRVGRSNRLAYAYFTFKREKILTDTAFERLNAIIEFTEMGSGIKIAMRDLEIRGAGNILGAEQHGHMDKIGYELYSKLLREELSGEEENVIELDMRLSAYIPEDYIESVSARMDAYKEIAEIKNQQEEKEFISSIEDAYGEIPKEVLNLIDIAVVKSLAKQFFVSKISVTADFSGFTFKNLKPFALDSFHNAIDKFNDFIVISMSNVPKLRFVRKSSNENTLKMMRSFLKFASD